MSKPVSHIFGSEAKVKMMRLFIFNPNSFFTSAEVAGRVQERGDIVNKELRNLSKAGLIKRRAKGYVLDHAYPYITPLSNFLIDASPLTEKEIIKKISSAVTNLRLVLVSGVFLHEKDSRVDVLVVADHIRQAKLASAMSSIEAELGKELRFTAFDTTDFRYRVGIYDKLVRDILDFRHEKILNKLGI